MYIFEKTKQTMCGRNSYALKFKEEIKNDGNGQNRIGIDNSWSA